MSQTFISHCSFHWWCSKPSYHTDCFTDGSAGNLKFLENSLCSTFHCNDEIRTPICICHGSSVSTYEKLWYDYIIILHMRARYIYSILLLQDLAMDSLPISKIIPMVEMTHTACYTCENLNLSITKKPIGCQPPDFVGLMAVRWSYLYNGNYNTGKMTSSYIESDPLALSCMRKKVKEVSHAISV